MMLKISVFFMLLNCWHFVSEASVESSLRFVHALWRHGDRNPANTFPTDHNTASTWYQGFGELTTIGMKQQYELGTYIRNRYAVNTTFLQTNYSAFEIYIRSTDYNRTLMSAAANLAGMYPASGNAQFLQNLTWQPIPIHTVPKTEDIMLWMDRPCPVEENAYFNGVQKSVEALAIMKNYSHLLDFLRNETNTTIENLDQVWTVFDPLNAEKYHSDTNKWPDWMNESLYWQIVELYDITTGFYFPTLEIQKLRGGLLFFDIADRMEAKRNSTLDPRLKYYAYSVHDTTLMALLENFGAYDDKAPSYAQSMFIELHEINQEFHVEVYYRNHTSGDIRLLNIAGCTPADRCPLKQFRDRSLTHLPTDWYADCGLKSAADHALDAMRRTVYILGGFIAILLLVVVALASLLWINRRGYRRGLLVDADDY